MHTPRLHQPRPIIPKGAIGIGGRQEASILWLALGLAVHRLDPVKIFAPERLEPFLLRSGDRVRSSVSAEDGSDLARRQASGEIIMRQE